MLEHDDLIRTYRTLRIRNVPAHTAIERARTATETLYSAHNITYNLENEANSRWIENVTPSLRLAGFADEIRPSIGHRGWYTNDENLSEDILRGIVYRLPSRNGKAQFIYGYADPCNDNCALLCFDPVDDEKDAARLADKMAEKYAEQAREYNEAWRAGSNYSQAISEISEARQSAIELIKAIRKHRSETVEPVICQTLRSHIKSYIRDIQGLKAQRDMLLDQFSAAWRKDTHAAFNDGAGFTAIA